MDRRGIFVNMLWTLISSWVLIYRLMLVLWKSMLFETFLFGYRAETLNLDLFPSLRWFFLLLLIGVGIFLRCWCRFWFWFWFWLWFLSLGFVIWVLLFVGDESRDCVYRCYAVMGAFHAESIPCNIESGGKWAVGFQPPWFPNNHFPPHSVFSLLFPRDIHRDGTYESL